MVKKLLILIFISSSLIIKSQTLSEILSISFEKPIGTARFESMGGAFGALGGDISSINTNPASGAVFIDNEFGIQFVYSEDNPTGRGKEDTALLIESSEFLKA